MRKDILAAMTVWLMFSGLGTGGIYWVLLHPEKDREVLWLALGCLLAMPVVFSLAAFTGYVLRPSRVLPGAVYTWSDRRSISLRVTTHASSYGLIMHERVIRGSPSGLLKAESETQFATPGRREQWAV